MAEGGLEGDASRTDRDARFLARARHVLLTEADAVHASAERVGEAFVRAVDLLLGLTGRVLVTGVGKSGVVARKLAATLTSTGTPAIFLHPVDAMHGDLGVLGAGDVVILVSKSGDTDELNRMVPVFRRLHVTIVLLTSAAEGRLVDAADVVLSTGPVTEASRIALVPTTSTLAQLALGDALAVVVMEERGFREDDFAFLHPGGVIGRTIGRRVRDLMHAGDALPIVSSGARMPEVLREISEKRIGMTTVVDGDGRLTGIVTDGDMKRILLKHGEVMTLEVSVVMTREPVTIGPDASVLTAVERMENNPGGSITSLVVLDEDGRPIGVVHLHDCLRA